MCCGEIIEHYALDNEVSIMRFTLSSLYKKQIFKPTNQDLKVK